MCSCSDEELQAAIESLPAEEQEVIKADGFVDPAFKVHDGNAQPQGFGHIGFLVDDLDGSCTKMEENGAIFKKKPQDGNMRGIAFVYDPNGYWIELIDRKATFAGTC